MNKATKTAIAVAIALAGFGSAVWSAWPEHRKLPPPPGPRMGGGGDGDGPGPGLRTRALAPGEQPKEVKLGGGGRGPGATKRGPAMPGHGDSAPPPAALVDPKFQPTESESDRARLASDLEHRVDESARAVSGLSSTPTTTASQIAAAARTAVVAIATTDPESIAAAVRELGGTLTEKGRAPVMEAIANLVKGAQLDASNARIEKIATKANPDFKPPEPGAGPATGKVAVRMNRNDSAEPGGATRSVNTMEFPTGDLFAQVQDYENLGLPTVQVFVPVIPVDGDFKPGEAELQVILCCEAKSGRWQPAAYGLCTTDQKGAMALMKKLQAAVKQRAAERKTGTDSK